MKRKTDTKPLPVVDKEAIEKTILRKKIAEVVWKDNKITGLIMADSTLIDCQVKRVILPDGTQLKTD